MRQGVCDGSENNVLCRSADTHSKPAFSVSMWMWLKPLHSRRQPSPVPRLCQAASLEFEQVSACELFHTEFEVQKAEVQYTIQTVGIQSSLMGVIQSPHLWSTFNCTGKEHTLFNVNATLQKSGFVVEIIKLNYIYISSTKRYSNNARLHQVKIQCDPLKTDYNTSVSKNLHSINIHVLS